MQVARSSALLRSFANLTLRSVPCYEGRRDLNTLQRLRNSARGKNWDEWYHKFKTEDPYYVDDPTHHRWFPKEIREQDKELEARLYQRLFDSTPEEINFKRACNAVDTIRLDHGIEPQSWMYAGVLLQIGSVKDVYYMTYFWKQLQQNSNVKLGANAYNAIVRSFAENVDIEGAQYVIEEMKAKGLEVNANTYNNLCYFYRPSLYFMEAIMETLENKKIKPNADTYTLMINTYTRELDFANANKMFSTITDSGLTPHVWAFNSLMRSRCKAEFPNEAREVLEHMHDEKPFGVSPNTDSYNALLQYYESHGKDEETQELFNLMRERNVKMDVETYNCLIRSKYNSGKAREGIEIFERFNYRRNEATYAAAIDCCVQGGEYDKAAKYHAIAKGRGYTYGERVAMPTYFDPIPLVYPRRPDYWEVCGDHHMTWDRAVSFDKL